MSDILKTSFDVTVNGVTYTFKIPSIAFDIETSYKSQEIRQRAYPAGGGALAGADGQAFRFSRCAAYMELYLTAATDPWPYSVGLDKAPVVDFQQFPPTKADEVYAVGDAFETDYGRFRRTGSFDNPPAGKKIVAGEQNPGSS